MRQCPNCDSIVVDDAVFCSHCGTSLEISKVDESHEVIEAVPQITEETKTQPQSAKVNNEKLIPTSISAAAIVAFILAFYAFINWLNPTSVIVALVAIVVAIIGIARTSKGKHAGRGLAVASLILAIFVFVALFVTVLAIAYIIDLPSVSQFISEVGNFINSVGHLMDELSETLAMLQETLPLLTDAANTVAEISDIVHNIGVVVSTVAEILLMIKNVLTFIPFI
ncbi:MAG: zinc ribbon domain-containing protein [Clostridia bacterium]|nr:zinc ribbon domain-containing protein [Clostridia bacterium]